MELLAAAPQNGHEVRLLQQDEMLGHGLPGHVQVGAELPERLPVVSTQTVQQLPAAGVGQRLEDLVHIGIHGYIMQPLGCMSRQSRSSTRRSFPEPNLWLGGPTAGMVYLWIDKEATSQVLEPTVGAMLVWRSHFSLSAAAAGDLVVSPHDDRSRHDRHMGK